ncbi:MAG: Imm61 family immunity protein [Glaciihabitans sp.]
MNVRQLGQSLSRWLEPYGIHDEPSSDHETLLTDDGHEVRWYITEEDNVFHVARAERAGSPFEKLQAFDLSDVERFMVLEYGPSLRRKVLPSAPRIRIPFRIEDIAPGFELVATPDGPLEAALMHDGRVRARFSSYERPSDAVGFSYVANRTVDDIKATFLADGGDMFALDPARHPPH